MRPGQVRAVRRAEALNPSQILILGFGLFVLLGALLLMLPVSHAGPAHGWVDDVFMAASAVCVTGLTSIDPATRYSGFGQAVLLFLIQIGGLGYMTIFTLGLLLIGKQLSMRDRLALQQVTERPGLLGLLDFIQDVARFTLVAEGLGFLWLLVQTVPEAGWARGAWLALFHAVSSFNNAGFSLFSDNAIHWQHAPWPLFGMAALVVVGGLGYAVNQELVRRLVLRRPGRWSTLFRIVVGMTAGLLAAGALGLWLFERGNPATLGALGPVDQVANAVFMAVQPRTAGFNSLDLTGYTHPSLLLTMVLMFIGGGPGGTAGGIKLTTVAVVAAATLAAVRGQEDVTLPGMRRRVSEAIVRKAFAVLTLSLALVVAATAALTLIEPLDFLGLLFEVTSAFATVGLSMGVTPELSDAGKLIVAGTMLAGRVGVLAIALALYPNRRPSVIRYADEPLLIG